VLGPLEVRDEHGPVSLGTPQQRALLAVLLLNPNEVVSRDRLIDELWGERPPETAAKLVQVYVSRLRKVLEPKRAGGADAVLLTQAPGYLLRVGRDELDVERFERLVDEGRKALAAGAPGDAAARLREALALWRGPPLGDFSFEPFAAAEIGRLEELHMTALEDRIEADLAVGHTDLIGELEALIARNPLRERLRGQLMLALYRTGRQSEALEAYRETRKTLVEEVGVEPGPELRRLEQAILAHDPALDRRPAREAPSEPARGTFVGREREMAELTGSLDDALAGRGRLVLLVGEPGIGKSRLADELMDQARARGARVMVGRCWEAGGAPPYWPWVQSLRAYVDDTAHEALREQLGPGAADLAQLLPELRELFPDLPEPPALEAEGARFRLFEAVSAFLSRATQARPLVFALDDLHAADEPSLLLLQFVAREMATSRLLVVCAFRDVDPTLRDPLTSVLGEVVRERHTTQIALAGLSRDDIAEYIELSTGVQAEPRVAEAVYAETEGNPLFVAEAVRLLEAEGQIADPDAALRIPPGVRAVIDQRLRRLSERCRSVLVPASVLGREFELDPLGQVSELGREELLDALGDAVAERILADVPASPGRLRFGHALIRDTLYESLTPARRMQLHKEAAEAVAAAHSDNLGPHLTELAHHYVVAAPAGTADEAVEYASRAGRRAASQLAYEEAARLYGMALTLVDEPGARCDLLLALGDAQGRAGDSPASKLAFREAAELADEGGLSEPLARAALGYGGRILWEVSRDDPYIVSLLERAIAALGDVDSELRVRLLARLAGGPLRDVRFPPERKRELSREALEVARRLGEPGTLAYALAAFIAAHHSPDFTPEQLVVSTEHIDAAMEAGDLERAAEGHEHRITARIELGDMRGAKADLAAMERLAEELRQPSQDWFVTVYGALLALLEGKFSRAEELISRAWQVGERAQGWNAAVSYGLQLYVLRREQDRLGEVEDLVRQSVEEYRTYPLWRCVLAHMEAQLGNVADARVAFDELAAQDFGGLPFDEEWLVSVSFLAETARSLGDAERASVLYEQVLPYENRIACSYPEISTGAVARYLGLLAATSTRGTDAERHFKAALEVNGRSGARPWLAHTQDDYARMLAARNEAGDRERALELIGLAHGGYRDLGMDGFAAKAEALEQDLTVPAR
jgi:DNA-binding SARP family transcriptional activator/tetratricopeptide (TPR) repeat protein